MAQTDTSQSAQEEDVSYWGFNSEGALRGVMTGIADNGLAALWIYKPNDDFKTLKTKFKANPSLFLKEDRDVTFVKYCERGWMGTYYCEVKFSGNGTCNGAWVENEKVTVEVIKTEPRRLIMKPKEARCKSVVLNGNNCTFKACSEKRPLGEPTVYYDDIQDLNE